MMSPEVGPEPNYVERLSGRPNREVLTYKDGSAMDVIRQPETDINIGAVLDFIPNGGAVYVQMVDARGAQHGVYIDGGAMVSERLGPAWVGNVGAVRKHLKGQGQDLTVTTGRTSDGPLFQGQGRVELVAWPCVTGIPAGHQEQNKPSAPTAVGARLLETAREELSG
jgi:hypothetical protein